MGLLRYDCHSSVTHDSILVEFVGRRRLPTLRGLREVLEVPDDMRRAYGEQIEVACPECNTEMDYNIIDN